MLLRILLFAGFLLGLGKMALAQEPPVLWYDEPAADWNQALPVGNGRPGAMVFGGYARERLIAAGASQQPQP